eukprot:gene3635-5655_t
MDTGLPSGKSSARMTSPRTARGRRLPQAKQAVPCGSASAPGGSPRKKAACARKPANAPAPAAHAHAHAHAPHKAAKPCRNPFAAAAAQQRPPAAAAFHPRASSPPSPLLHHAPPSPAGCSSPALSGTHKRPSSCKSGRSLSRDPHPVSPMLAASSRSSSSSPPRPNWGVVRPQDITTKDQWESLMNSDLEIADEISDQCERMASAGAGIDIIADQIRELERVRELDNSDAGVLYYSACDTRSTQSSCHSFTPPMRSPSPGASEPEFGSVNGVLQRSLKVQDITERRPAANAGGGADPLYMGAEEKRLRRDQLLKELLTARPPRQQICTVTADIGTLSGDDVPANLWTPQQRRFSKRPNTCRDYIAG